MEIEKAKKRLEFEKDELQAALEVLLHLVRLFLLRYYACFGIS